MAPRLLITYPRSEQLDRRWGNYAVIIKCTCAQAYTLLHYINRALYAPDGVPDVLSQSLPPSLPPPSSIHFCSSIFPPPLLFSNEGIPALQSSPALDHAMSKHLFASYEQVLSLHVCAQALMRIKDLCLCWLEMLTGPV